MSELLGIVFVLTVTAPFWAMLLYPIYLHPIKGTVFVVSFLLMYTAIHIAAGLTLALPLYLLGYHPSGYSDYSDQPRRQ